MNKYLEKVAAKLTPDQKDHVYATLYAHDKRVHELDIPEHAKPVIAQHSGQLSHDVARDLAGHKYGKTYAQGRKKLYDNLEYIKTKRMFKDALGKDPVSTRPDSLRVSAIAGRILRRGK